MKNWWAVCCSCGIVCKQYVSSKERGWVVCCRFVYATIYLLTLCQKPVWEATKRKLQRVLLLVRNLAWLDTIENFKIFKHIPVVLYSIPHIVMKKLNQNFQFWGVSYLKKKRLYLPDQILLWDQWMKYTIAYFALCIFPAADGLKKSYQLFTSLNKIHTDIHDLQVFVVERV